MTVTPVDVVIAGLPAAAVVVALVAAARALGLPKRYAPAASVVAGLAVTLLAELVVALPGTRGWVEAAVVGVVLGLSATGAYAVVAKTARSKS